MLITDVLGIKYPILQGGMAFVSEAGLAAAVSNAGGAGIIGACEMSAEWVRQEIRKAKKLTDKPFGVNIMLMSKNIDEVVEVIAEEKVPFATFGAGNPLPYIKKLHSAGVKCIPVTANVKQAQKVAEAGADAVISEGMESGGHIGTLTTMALMTQVINAVNIPVVIAGGIGDGRGIAAALLMGAAGVQIGTRFLAAEECPIHIEAKKRLVDAVETETVVIGSTLKGEAMRGLNCKAAKEYLSYEGDGMTSPDELKKKARAIDYLAAFHDGRLEDGMLLCGQSLRAITRIAPAAEIIEELMAETKETLAEQPTKILKQL